MNDESTTYLEVDWVLDLDIEAELFVQLVAHLAQGGKHALAGEQARLLVALDALLLEYLVRVDLVLLDLVVRELVDRYANELLRTLHSKQHQQQQKQELFSFPKIVK